MAQARLSSVTVSFGQPIYGGWWAGGRLIGGVTTSSSQAAGVLGSNAADVSGDVVLASTVGAGSLVGVVVPSWAPPVGQWGTLPDSTWYSSGAVWAGTFPGGSTGVRSVFTAWCGGVLNTVGIYRGGSFVPGSFMVVFGGGHGDYGGNELYAYGPLDSDAPTWSRITDPTLPAPNNVARTAEGYPVSRHTYDTLQFVPGLNQMICAGTPGYYSLGFGFDTVDAFDFDVNPAVSNPWLNYDAGWNDGSAGGASSINGTTGYDPLTNKIWNLGQGNVVRLKSFDAGTGTWTVHYKDNPNGPSNAKASLDYTNKLYVFRSDAGDVYAQDLNNPTSAIYTPTCTGTAPPASNTTMEWDAVGNRHVLWPGSGSTVYFLTPGANPGPGGDAWTWSSHTPSAGATPANGDTNGVYGRYRMATFPWGRGIVLLPAYNAPGVFYRMS